MSNMYQNVYRYGTGDGPREEVQEKAPRRYQPKRDPSTDGPSSYDRPLSHDHAQGMIQCGGAASKAIPWKPSSHHSEGYTPIAPTVRPPKPRKAAHEELCERNNARKGTLESEEYAPITPMIKPRHSTGASRKSEDFPPIAPTVKPHNPRTASHTSEAHTPIIPTSKSQQPRKASHQRAQYTPVAPTIKHQHPGKASPENKKDTPTVPMINPRQPTEALHESEEYTPIIPMAKRLGPRKVADKELVNPLNTRTVSHERKKYAPVAPVFKPVRSSYPNHQEQDKPIKPPLSANQEWEEPLKLRESAQKTSKQDVSGREFFFRPNAMNDEEASPQKSFGMKDFRPANPKPLRLNVDYSVMGFVTKPDPNGIDNHTDTDVDSDDESVFTSIDPVRMADSEVTPGFHSRERAREGSDDNTFGPTDVERTYIGPQVHRTKAIPVISKTREHLVAQFSESVNNSIKNYEDEDDCTDESDDFHHEFKIERKCVPIVPTPNEINSGSPSDECYHDDGDSQADFRSALKTEKKRSFNASTSKNIQAIIQTFDSDSDENEDEGPWLGDDVARCKGKNEVLLAEMAPHDERRLIEAFVDDDDVDEDGHDLDQCKTDSNVVQADMTQHDRQRSNWSEDDDDDEHGSATDDFDDFNYFIPHSLELADPDSLDVMTCVPCDDRDGSTVIDEDIFQSELWARLQHQQGDTTLDKIPSAEIPRKYSKYRHLLAPSAQRPNLKNCSGHIWDESTNYLESTAISQRNVEMCSKLGARVAEITAGSQSDINALHRELQQLRASTKAVNINKPWER